MPKLLAHHGAPQSSHCLYHAAEFWVLSYPMACLLGLPVQLIIFGGVILPTSHAIGPSKMCILRGLAKNHVYRKVKTQPGADN